MADSTVYTSIARGRPVQLKPEIAANLTTIAPSVYRSQRGGLYTTKKVPSIATLSKYADNGVCPTPCGCRVEPDGYCQHNIPSWMIIAGVI